MEPHGYRTIMGEPEDTSEDASEDTSIEEATRATTGPKASERAPSAEPGTTVVDALEGADTTAEASVAAATVVDSRGVGTGEVGPVDATVVQTTLDPSQDTATRPRFPQSEIASALKSGASGASGAGGADAAMPAGSDAIRAAPSPPSKPSGDAAWQAFDDRADDLWPIATAEGAAVEPSTHDFERIATPSHSVIGSDAGSRGAASARLVLVGSGSGSGSDGVAGRQFDLRPGDNSIGRSHDNDIVLDDGSVSRHHARVLADDERFVITDERSGNGVFVNGERVDRARLVSGDEVVVGSVVLRFLEAGADDAVEQHALGAVFGAVAAKPGRAIAAAPSVLLAVKIALSVALACAVLALGLQAWRVQVQGQTAETLPLKQQYLREGEELYKARQWDSAEKRFTMLLHLEPEHTQATRYLQGITAGRASQERLLEARRAFQAGRTGRAHRLAKGLVDSSYRDEAAALLKAVEVTLLERVEAARVALGAGDPQRALDELAIVQETEIDWPGVAPLRKQAEQALGARRSRATASRGPRAADGLGLPAGGVANGPGPGAVWAPSAADERALQRLLEAGEFEAAERAASQLLDTAASRTLSRRVAGLRSDYDTALRAYRAKRAAAALGLFGAVREQVATLVPAGSAVLRQIDERLADMYYVRGIEAQLGDDLEAAYEAFSLALRWQPGHAAAGRKVSELNERAAAIYAEAVAAIATDAAAARRRLELVIRMLPTDSALARQARQQLAALR